MKQQYEYLFVRVGEGWLAASSAAEREYQRIIRDHARDGWRLVQIFAPSMGAYGASKYYEVVLERPVE